MDSRKVLVLRISGTAPLLTMLSIVGKPKMARFKTQSPEHGRCFREGFSSFLRGRIHDFS
jgi:hypothetical protein